MKNKGISLIVLIITIVVIIILGTAIIVNIAKTNIIDNANEATLKSDVANLKSELEMYVTDQFVVTKGKYDREKLHADVGQAKYNEENIEDKNNDGKTNIYDILNSLKNSSLDGAIYIQEGDIIFIRAKFNTSQLKVLAKMGEEIDGKPKITDIVSKSDFTSITVSADVTNPEEVEKYIYILNGGEGIETTESSKTFEGLEPATKYTVTIKALLKDGTEIEMVKEISTLDNTPPIEPVINSSYGYPLITEYGVVGGGKTTIKFDASEGVKNEYSLNNGVTWNEYKGAFYVNEACTIMAKSLKPNGLESSSSVTVSVKNDAIGGEAYDDDPESCASRGDKYINVSEEMQGQYVYIKNNGYMQIWMYNSEGTQIKAYKEIREALHRLYIEPNTVKMKIYTYMYDIYPDTTPIITRNSYIYPLITENGIQKSYSLVSIKYFSTAKNKLYKIDNGEWKEYIEGNIKLMTDEVLYAKSIDENGKESVVGTYKAEDKTDAIGVNAYDDDPESRASRGENYINVSEEMQGQYVYIKNDGYMQIWMYNSEGTQIKAYKEIREALHRLYIEPNTVKMKIYTYMYDIYPDTTPIINSNYVYPLITKNGVQKSYSVASIKYFSTAKKKLYKIDDGEWKEYTGGNIKVITDEVLYAKSIDENGKESVVGTYKAEDKTDAIGVNAYDDDPDSYDPRASKYINVSEEMQGKYVYIKNNGYMQIWMYNSEGTQIKAYKEIREALHRLYIEPNTVKMKIYTNMYDIYPDTN